MFRKLVSIALVAGGLLGAKPALAGGDSSEARAGASRAEPGSKEDAARCECAGMQPSPGQRPEAMKQARAKRVKDPSPLERYPMTVPSDG